MSAAEAVAARAASFVSAFPPAASNPVEAILTALLAARGAPVDPAAGAAAAAQMTPASQPSLLARTTSKCRELVSGFKDLVLDALFGRCPTKVASADAATATQAAAQCVAQREMAVTGTSSAAAGTLELQMYSLFEGWSRQAAETVW